MPKTDVEYALRNLHRWDRGCDGKDWFLLTPEAKEKLEEVIVSGLENGDLGEEIILEQCRGRKGPGTGKRKEVLLRLIAGNFFAKPYD